MMNRMIVAVGILTAAGLAGCGGTMPSNPGNNPTTNLPENTDPDTVVSGDPYTVRNGANESVRQNSAVRRSIYEGNALGSNVFATSLNTRIASLNLSVTYQDNPMTPGASRAGNTTRSGGGEFTDTTPGIEIPHGISGVSCAYAQQQPSIPTNAVSCRDIVQNAIADAMNRLDREIEREPLDPMIEDGAPLPEEVRAWYTTAASFTVTSSMPIAISALRETGACDTAPTVAQAAGEIGNRLGRQIMQEAARAQQARTPITECNTDNGIVNPARNVAMGQVPSTRDQNALCPGFTGSAGETERLSQATSELEQGIIAGIAEQANLESARLVREWVCIPPRPAGGGGDPLVLDMNGDGIHIESATNGAMFDFGHGTEQSEWVYGDAFLVLDHAGDGVIQAADLFGDVHVTADGAQAADGLAALALYDAPSRGGNGDGRLDANDAVFSRLSVWTDVNGNAVAEAGELSSASSQLRGFALANGSFTTADGHERTAVDVWFNTFR